MTAHKIGFLIWPSTKALTLALAEEALRVAQRVHPEVVYELSFLLAEPATDGAWQLPGEPWAGKLEGFQKLFLLADEPPAVIASQLSTALKQLVRAGCVIGGLSAGVYPLAQLGLLDGYRAAVHWRWQDDFAERFPKVIATSHLFDWDRDRLTACGGMAVMDMLLALLARDHGAELAGAVSEELGRSMAEVALAWTARRPGVSSVLVGASRVEQLHQPVAPVAGHETELARQLAGIEKRKVGNYAGSLGDIRERNRKIDLMADAVRRHAPKLDSKYLAEKMTTLDRQMGHAEVLLASLISGLTNVVSFTVDELGHDYTGITGSEGEKVNMHDIGHGPFSHTLEHTLIAVPHERLSELFMEALDEEFGGALHHALAIFKNR